MIDNPLFWPLVVSAVLVLVLLVILIRFADLGALWRTIRNALPNRAGSFAQQYLRAIDKRLGNTHALMVIGSSDASRLDLNLLDAFSPIRLRQDRDDAAHDSAPDDSFEGVDGDIEGAFIRLLPSRPGMNKLPRKLRSSYVRLLEKPREPNIWRDQVIPTTPWLLAQLPLLLIALALIGWLLWSPQDGLRLEWPHIAGALVTVGVWFLLARWIHLKLIDDKALDQLLTWWKERRKCVAKAATPGAEAWEHRRLLIRGAPGSGKTTLLRHMAVICARDLRGEARKWRKDRVRDAYGWPRRPFPIYIPLRALPSAALRSDVSLLDNYVDALPTLLGDEMKRCDRDFFVQRARRGGCLVLIDGLDELGSPAARSHMGKLVADLPAGPARNPNLIIVTSRIVGYEGQLDDKGFVRRRVADLNDDQVEAFIKARYLAIAATERRAAGGDSSSLLWSPEDNADRLIRRLPTNPGLRRLSRNPLLLSLAVAVHRYQRERGQELPQERYRLYEEALKLLAHDWDRMKDEQIGLDRTDETSDLNLDEKLRLLRELAWVMFEQAPADGDERAHAIILGSAARAALAQTLAQIPRFAPDKIDAERRSHADSEAERWLRNLEQRGGVLQVLGNVSGSSEVTIQFAHLSFQEYLAARAAAGENQDKRGQRIREKWNTPHWREVLLLYAASADATPVIKQLAQQRDHAGCLLCGDILIERPIKLASQEQARVINSLRDLALTATDADETTARKALAQLEELRALPDRAALLHAAEHAPYAAVRARLIEVLVGVEPNQPVAEPAPPDVRDLALRTLASDQDYRPRTAAGFALARNDPRYAGAGWIPQLVEIPAGPFLMGSSEEEEQADDDEKPQHQLELPTYWIGRTPVTNAQWRRFVEAGGYSDQRYWTATGWAWAQSEAERPNVLQRVLRREERRQRQPITQPNYWDDSNFNSDNQPVVGVSWYEAVAYCRWLSDATGQAFYLPSEAEWEKAARGTNGRIYPWGNAWETGHCNTEEAGIGCPSSVGSFPAGASPYGALDMAGNVWEWCVTKYGKSYPYDTVEPEWEATYLEGTNVRRVRGGAYWNGRTFVRGAYRHYLFFNPRDRDIVIGLRVARRSPRPDAES